MRVGESEGSRELTGDYVDTRIIRAQSCAPRALPIMRLAPARLGWRSGPGNRAE